jgi:hypothetical protein
MYIFEISTKRFSLPFQNFMPDIEIMKFCQNHWSLMGNRSRPPTQRSHLRQDGSQYSGEAVRRQRGRQEARHGKAEEEE